MNMDPKLKIELETFLWSLIERDIFEPDGRTMQMIKYLLRRIGRA